METLMACGYFSEGVLTRANAIAAAVLYEQTPQTIYLLAGRINTGKPKVAEVMRSSLLEHGVPEEHIVVAARAGDTIQEVFTYNRLLRPGQTRNFVANQAHLPRLLLIINREGINPIGMFATTQDVLDSGHQYALLDELRRSRQQQWLEKQEEQVMKTLTKYPFSYNLYKMAGRTIPLKGDLQYLSYLSFERRTY